MGSSSRRKYSKKKSSKLSSKARKMKKSRWMKSRKLGRRHDSDTDGSISSTSDSYSSKSDDDSISSKSVSASSSEDTYRRRSNSSRLKRHVKKRKRQTRRRSSSGEDNRELYRSRKRKRSKKDGDSKSRKKSLKKKKLRRDVEISSASSDSPSCSACSDNERVRRRYRETKKDMRNRHIAKLGSPLRVSRSPSHSSYSGYQDGNRAVSQSEETFMFEKNSRRLRSVIVFAEKAEPSTGEENESDRDMQKEELVYDHDDYPSKSSSGEGIKKVSTPCPPIVSDDRQQVKNAGFISNNVVTEWTESRIDIHEEDHVHNPSSDEFETNSYMKKHTNDVPSGNDLEAILKQKALENLNKFRGVLKSNVKPTAHWKDEDNSDHNGSSISKNEIVQSKLSKQEAAPAEVEQDLSDGEFTGKVLDHPIGRPDLGESAIGNSSFGETSGIDPTQKQTKSASPVSVDKSYIETEAGLRNPEPKTDQSKSSSININHGTACSSAFVESAASEKQSLNNQPDEAKDGSQYQQKTMSVMRGGEMVQVNYKVYIPKRTPALARRQLKR